MRYLIGGDGLAREVEVSEEGAVSTTALHCSGTRLPLHGGELAVLLDAARWRYDISHWRWARSGPDGHESGVAERDFDDSGWAVCPHLHPLYYPAYDDHAWFRHDVLVPEMLRGEPVTFVLGGMDDEDWDEYRVFLDGAELERWRSSGGLREPRRITLAAGDERYGLLSFGETHLLAIETRGLARPRDSSGLVHPDHLVFQNWLLDQFVCSPAPYDLVDAFDVKGVRGETGQLVSTLELDVEARARPGLSGTLTYAYESGCLRKSVVLENSSNATLRLLDLTLEDLRGDFSSTRGGRGQPILTERFFSGLEHPAGVNQGDSGRLVVRQLPAIELVPGASFASETTVIGAAVGGKSVEEAFREYLFGLRPRPRERVPVYSALGWYDYSNPADPLSELSADLVEENLIALDDVRRAGTAFDIYMLDDWWEPTNLSEFRRRTFPQGAEALAAQLAERGMRPGLWSGTTRSVWTSGEAPGIEASVAGGTGMSPPRPDDGEDAEWSWDEEWGALFTRERRLCLASEPYWTHFRDAMTHYVRDVGVGLLKFDTATLHCTASNHDHVSGKYSVEPIMRRLTDLIESLREANPELTVVLYWTFRSPWWLRFADTMFDKGLKMELASPSTTPSAVYRQSINLHLDQAARHASLIPLPLQDSLGLWWGNVALTNRFGKEEWRDAFLLELARGGLLMQCWGDVDLLDADDRRFLADVSTWAKGLGPAFLTTTPVAGDPRRAEPYGYAQRAGDTAVVTLFNPSFETREASVDLSSLSLPDGDYVVAELYPFPGLTSLELFSEGVVPLEPFEVRCLEVAPSAIRMGRAHQERPQIHSGRTLEVSPTGDSDGADVLRARVELPEVRRNERLALIASFQDRGVPWYHPDPRSLVSLSAKLHGIEVYSETVPAVRAWTGLGSPWLLWSIPAGPAWSGEEIRVQLRDGSPDNVDVTLKAVLFEPWWKLHDRRFAAASAAAATS